MGNTESELNKINGEISDEINKNFVIDGLIVCADAPKLVDSISRDIIKLFNTNFPCSIHAYLKKEELDKLGLGNNSLNLNFIIRHLVILALRRSRTVGRIRIISLTQLKYIYDNIENLVETKMT